MKKITVIGFKDGSAYSLCKTEYAKWEYTGISNFDGLTPMDTVVLALHDKNCPSTITFFLKESICFIKTEKTQEDPRSLLAEYLDGKI